MYKKLLKTGIAFTAIGLILLFLGFLFSNSYFLFNYNILWESSELINVSGVFLFILGILFTIIGAFIKYDTKKQPIKKQKEQKEICSGTCPVCHQQFETTAEVIGSYYVFNCNKCNSKLRVKKLTFYPVG